ncbi:MAG: cobalt ECF transporter T component CbiQ [Nitrospiraceae bacterium]|nr:cobalt ECF transporter T component CbiQ [Nitrospiraceae bacterium]
MWLLEKQGQPQTGVPERKKFRSGLMLDRTLKAALSFVEDAFFNEKTAARNGFLQRVEPRAKMVIIFSLLVSLSLQHSLPGMLRFVVLGFFLAVLSRIPLNIYLKRLLPGVLLTTAVALPASLGALVPGEPIFTIITFKKDLWLLGHSIYISRQGLFSALALMARVTGSITIVLLAGFTTRPPELIKAVNFFIPGFLRTVFSMSYRYMFFLVKRLEEFILARRARGGAYTGQAGLDRKWVGSRAASLLIISLELKKELKFAMEARGAGDEVREAGLPAFRFGLYEALFLALAAGTVII